MHIIEYHSEMKRIRLLICTTKWMNLKNTMFSKVSRYKSICTVWFYSYEQAKLIYSGREQICDCRWLGVVRRELTAKGQKGTFLNNENVLYLYWIAVCIGTCFSKVTKPYVLYKCILLYVDYSSINLFKKPKQLLKEIQLPG